MKSSKKVVSLVMGPSQIILGMVILIRRTMHNNKIYGGPTVVCCQSLHAYFYCRKLVVEVLQHVSKSLSCVSELQANGSTCHPFIGG